MPITRDFLTPEGVYQKKEMKEIVLATLQKIPDDQRKVILMKEYEGLKFKEIAEVLNVSENTIKSRMYYGLDAMRKILIEKNITKELYYE
jgi:RNA polymerase sigma-70 factor (ECF subfamily)